MITETSPVHKEPATLPAQAGVFFILEDLVTLFPLFKKNEAFLTVKERQLFSKIEKILYENLSIGEIESFLGEQNENS